MLYFLMENKDIYLSVVHWTTTTSFVIENITSLQVENVQQFLLSHSFCYTFTRLLSLMYILTSVVFVFPQVSAVCRSEIPPPNWSARSPPASVSHDSVYIPLLIGLHFTVNMLFVYRYHHHQLSHDSSVSRTFDTFTAPREPPPRDNLSVYALIENWDTPQIRCFSIKPTPLFKICRYEC